MFGSNPRVLITGANGLLGRLISQHLKKNGFIVFGMDNIPENELSQRFKQENNDRKNSVLGQPFPGKYFVADITNKKALQNTVVQLERIDLVVHLAAALEDSDPEIIKKVNIEGTRNVYEICKENNINRIIFASSITVVWDRYSNEEPYRSIKNGTYKGDAIDIPKIKPEIITSLPIHEIENEQFTLYLKSKIEGEWIATEYAEKYGITTILARFGTVTTRQEEENYLEERRASVLCGWDTARKFIETKARYLMNNFNKASAEPYFVIHPEAKNLWVDIDYDNTKQELKKLFYC